jgi:hypothetical protein
MASLKSPKPLWKHALIVLTVEALVFSCGVGFAAFTYNGGGARAHEAVVSLGNWTFNVDPWAEHYGKYGGYFTTGNLTNYINQTDRAARWAGDHFVTDNPTPSTRTNQLDVTNYSMLPNEVTNGTINIISFPQYEQVLSGSDYVDRKCTQIYQAGGVNQNFFYNHSGTSSINTVLIPNTYDSVRQGAFKSTSNLSTVYFQDGGSVPMTWGSNVFNNSAVSNLHLPNTLTTIGTQAFSNCYSLAKLDLSNTSLTDTNTYIAYNCSALTQVLFPSTLKKVGNYAFRNCTLLSSIAWDSDLASIGDYSFYGCSYNASLPGLTTLDLSGTSVTSLGSHAFTGDSYLSTVKLPATLNTVGTMCISDGTYTSMTFAGTTAQFMAISGVTNLWTWSSWMSTTCTKIYCSNGSISVDWSGFFGLRGSLSIDP